MKRKQYRESYKLTKKYGTSYFIATLLMNSKDRRNVYALYSLCRYADDIVDVANQSDSANAKLELDAFKADVLNAIKSNRDDKTLLGAIAKTWNDLNLDLEYLDRFFDSMSMDLTISNYKTFDDLLIYMDGSAAVIGEMVLPILVPDSSKREEMKPYARSLGNAFQLTNFLRDVKEDLDRGRIYIPLDDLKKFEIEQNELLDTPKFAELMKYEIERTRQLYFESYIGVKSLKGRRGACVRTAYRLYGGILDQIIKNDYKVFEGRALVPKSKKYKIAISEFLRSSKNEFKAEKFL